MKSLLGLFVIVCLGVPTWLGCTQPMTQGVSSIRGTYVDETKSSYWTFDSNTITIQTIGPFGVPIKYLVEYELKDNILCLRQIPDGSWYRNNTLEYFKEHNLIKIVFNEDITGEAGGGEVIYPQKTKFILYKE